MNNALIGGGIFREIPISEATIYFFPRYSQVSNENNPWWLFRAYKRWNPTQFCGEYFIKEL